MSLFGLMTIALLAATNPRPLTLKEAVEQTLRESLAIDVAHSTSDYWAARSDAERGPFVPNLFTELLYRREGAPAISPGYNFLFPADAITTQSAIARAGIQGKIPTGLEYELRASIQHAYTSDIGPAFNPSYRIPLEVTLSQPILRGRGLINAQALRLAQIRKQQSDAELVRVANDAALAVAEAYVRVQVALARLTNDQQTFERAKSAAATSEELVRAGRIAPAANLPEQVHLALREEDVSASQRALRDAELALALALNLPKTESVTAVEPLRLTEVTMSPKQAGDLAEARQPEVLASGRDVDVERLQVNVEKNSALPDLRLRAAAGVIGSSGVLNCVQGYLPDGVTPCAVPLALTGSGAAFNSIASFRYGYVEGGITFSMPLDWSPLKSSVRAAEANLHSSQQRLQSIKTRVRARAEDAAAARVDLLARLEKTRDSMLIAQKSVQTTREGFARGRSSIFDVIKAEELLNQVRARELDILERLALEGLRLNALTGSLLTSLFGPDIEGQLRRRPTSTR